MSQTLQHVIRAQMRRAFADTLDSVFNQSSLSDEDIQWIETLLLELRNRILALTAAKEHDQFTAQFDVQLIMQMLRNNAFEAADLDMFGGALFAHLKTIAMPVQDKALNWESIRSFRHVGSLIVHANMILDEIELVLQMIKSEVKPT